MKCDECNKSISWYDAHTYTVVEPDPTIGFAIKTICTKCKEKRDKVIDIELEHRKNYFDHINLQEREDDDDQEINC